MKERTAILKVFFILLFLLFLISPVIAQKIETVDGVKVIHNKKPKWGKKPKVVLEFVRQIGEFDAEDENYQFYQPIDIAQDKNGNIYILEYGNCCIKKFDPEGSYLATIGQKGKGPGEMENPMAFAINQDSEIYVLDFRNTRIQKFSPKGEEGGTIKMEMFDLPQAFKFLETGELVSHRSPFIRPNQEAGDLALISILNSEGEIVRTFGKIKEFKNERMVTYGNRVAFSIDSEDNIYLAFQTENRIEKYTPDGTLLFMMDRPVKYKINHKMVKRKMTMPDGRSVEMDLPDMTYVSGSIGIDHKNRLWVITYTKQPKINYEDPDNSERGEDEFEIFDKEGILLGKMPIPEQRGRMRIIGDRLFMINSSEEMCVYEYKIVDK